MAWRLRTLKDMRITMTIGELVASAFDAADSVKKDETDAAARWAAELVVCAVLENGRPDVAKMLDDPDTSPEAISRPPPRGQAEEVEHFAVCRDPTLA